MLAELVVSDLGVIAELSLTFDSGMTAVTGETGAGKTLVVEAIELLLGARADSSLIRVGCDEARVDGRFTRRRRDAGERTSEGNTDPHAPVDVDGDVDGEEEIVLTRVLTRSGRSRAYVNGKPVPVQALVDEGARLVDLHSQHGHQTLLHVASQRAALDAFGGVDLSRLRETRAVCRQLERERASLGGDERTRAREIDLLRFQVDELDGADLSDPDEASKLEEEESMLAGSVAFREAGERTVRILTEEGGASDSLGTAVHQLANVPVFSALRDRLRTATTEIDDIVSDLRRAADAIDEDPERLSMVRSRRQKLKELQRKYGDSVAAVLEERERLRGRLVELLGHDERAASIDREIAAARRATKEEAERVVAARREVSRELAEAVTFRLRSLAMENASVRIDVEDIADDGEGVVTFLLAANPGVPALPLSRAASGGELARVMLALRLALLDGREMVEGDPPDSLVFDEVDAGIGGQAAVAVGASLGALAIGRQVFVVTHLPQVAACADHHVLVRKEQEKRTTMTTVSRLSDVQRVDEIARMLSGKPESASARLHAEELLAGRTALVQAASKRSNHADDTSSTTTTTSVVSVKNSNKTSKSSTKSSTKPSANPPAKQAAGTPTRGSRKRTA